MASDGLPTTVTSRRDEAAYYDAIIASAQQRDGSSAVFGSLRDGALLHDPRLRSPTLLRAAFIRMVCRFGPSVLVPHGPTLCVRRLRTLRSHQLQRSDLKLPDDRHRYTASVLMLR